MLNSLFENFDVILSLDTETTGLDFKNNQIIELSCVRCVKENGEIVVTDEFDKLIKLPEGETIPPKIVELTHITDEMLENEGESPEKVCREFADLFKGERILVVAYNAQFDMNFIYYFLARNGCAHILKSIKMLDALTVYKDRRKFPHKLANAIEEYNLSDKVTNSHRAIDDTLALVEVLKAMDEEEDDLLCYINLFGYNPNHGISGTKISSITYKEQPFKRSEGAKLYNN